MTEDVKTLVEQLCRASDRVDECRHCPAYTVCPTGTIGYEGDCLFSNAASMIEQLTAELEQVKRERDAAVKDLEIHDGCATCKYYTFTLKQEPCCECLESNKSWARWQWRGPCAENWLRWLVEQE